MQPLTAKRSPRGTPRIAGHMVVLMPLVVLTACAHAVPVVPQPASYYEFTVGAPRDRTFDALLRVAHSDNLSVHVLEKSSGLLRCESTTLLASELATYCQYPFTNSRTGRPIDTFSGWSARALSDGAGPVWGRLTLNVVMTPTSPTSTNVNVRGNWAAVTTKEQYIVNSRMVLEKQLAEQLTRTLHPRDDEDRGMFEDE